MPGTTRATALPWLLQPLYLVCELVIATQARGYDLLTNTISALGRTECRTVCSPWHAGMNASFVLFGLLLAAGALLLRPAMPAGPVVSASVALWVLAGVGSAAVGLVPLGAHSDLHEAVAAPLFVAQPVALVLLAMALRRRHRSIAAYALVVGVACAVATVLFLLTRGGGGLDGLWERLALWPVKIMVAALAVALPRRTRYGR